ncbi:MAG: hypothetical protein ABW321_23350 [Polyangiales bacterium]
MSDRATDVPSVLVLGTLALCRAGTAAAVGFSQHLSSLPLLASGISR